jgi:SAM-dependent methyltransferase
VVGVDCSWETARQARRSHRNVSCSDLRRLAFRDGSFDVVCSFQVLEHLREPASFLAEAARVLRPAGVLILTTPNRLTSFSENPYHVKEYRAEELRELLLPRFSTVEILGVFGSDRVRGLERSRKRQVSRILGLDPLGLRRILPETLQKWAFARLARRVRRRMRSGDRESFRELDLSDFTIGKDRLDASLDLLAICGKAGERDVATPVPGD